MMRLNERVLFIAVVTLWLAAFCGVSALADSLTIECSPNPATANSVRNFRAIWQQDDGFWPTVLPGVCWEGYVDFSPTIGSVRPLLPDQFNAAEMDWFPEFGPPDGFVGFAGVVQLGTSTDVTKAIPSDPDAIAEVLGVYLVTDPDMIGQNYYDPATADPAFIPGDPDITLTTDLPPDTTDVLIRYLPDDEGEVYQPIGYVWLQPDPGPTNVLETSGDAKFDHGLDYEDEEMEELSDKTESATEGVPRRTTDVQDGAATSDVTVVPIYADVIGAVLGVYLATDPDMTGQNYYDPATAAPPFQPGDADITLTTNLPPGTTEVLIDYSVRLDVAVKTDGSGELVQMWIPHRDEVADDPETEADESRPETPEVLVPRHVPLWLVGVWADSTHREHVEAEIVFANELYDQWPEVRVISLPEGVPSGYERLYVSYYYPGTEYVIPDEYPLPMPYTVYAIPPESYESNPQPITELRINDAILGLDPMRTDTTDPALSPLLGVYDNPGLTGANYFDLTVPGTTANYDPPGGTHLDYGVITLAGTPEGGFLAGTTLYVKVSTFAVDGVWDNAEAVGKDYFGVGEDPDDPLYVPRAGAYCSKLGLIKLAQPLPPPEPDDITGAHSYGRQVFVTYRALSRRGFTPGRSLPAAIESVEVYPEDDEYDLPPGDVGVIGGTFVIGGDNELPLGTYGLRVGYRRRVADMPASGVVWLSGPAGNVIPMYYTGNGTPVGGAEYRVAVSGGLNMSNPKQWPSPSWGENRPWLDNKLIYDPRGNPMWYGPALMCLG